MRREVEALNAQHMATSKSLQQSASQVEAGLIAELEENERVVRHDLSLMASVCSAFAFPHLCFLADCITT